MGILRLLLRAFSRSRRPKLVVVERDTSIIRVPEVPRQRPAEDQKRRPPPIIAIQRTTQIKIVEVQELRGRAWVIDGDTIDIGGTRIRLSGIDAPEMDGIRRKLWRCDARQKGLMPPSLPD